MVVFEAMWRSSLLGKALEAGEGENSVAVCQKNIPDKGNKCLGLRCNGPGSSEEQ